MIYKVSKSPKSNSKRSIATTSHTDIPHPTSDGLRIKVFCQHNRVSEIFIFVRYFMSKYHAVFIIFSLVQFFNTNGWHTQIWPPTNLWVTWQIWRSFAIRSLVQTLRKDSDCHIDTPSPQTTYSFVSTQERKVMSERMGYWSYLQVEEVFKWS